MISLLDCIAMQSVILKHTTTYPDACPETIFWGHTPGAIFLGLTIAHV